MRFKIINDLLAVNRQIAFSIENVVDDSPTLFIKDFSNELTFTLTNNTAETLTIKEGIPISQEDIDKESVSIFYLSFPDLTADEVEKITLLTEGWLLAFFRASDPSYPGAYLALVSAKSLSIPPTKDSNRINIKLGNIKAGHKKVGSGSIVIDYFHLKGSKNYSSTEELVIAFSNPPDPALKELPLKFFWVKGDTVLVTEDKQNPIENQLSFAITNPTQEPLVGQKTPWGTEPPTFFISLIAANPPGYGALCTEEELSQLPLETEEVYQDLWQIQVQRQSRPYYWQLLPQNHEILGVRENASVQFKLDHLISTLSPGVTLMYIQYANIPGYNDGLYALPITKTTADEPTIVDFIVDNKDPYFGEEVTLRWKTYGGKCRLEINGKSQDVLPTDTIKIPAEKSLDFFLHCERENPSRQIFQKKSFEVHPIQIDFKVSPLALTAYEYFHEGIEITWNVVGAENCELLVNTDIQKVDNKGKIFVKPTQVINYTLNCYNSSRKYQVKQTYTAYNAFDIAKVFYPKKGAIYQWTLQDGHKEIIPDEGSKILALKVLKTGGTGLFPKGVYECLCVLRQNSSHLTLYPYKDEEFLPAVYMPIPPNTLDFTCTSAQLLDYVWFLTCQEESIKIYAGSWDGYDKRASLDKISLKTSLPKLYVYADTSSGSLFWFLNSSKSIKILSDESSKDIITSSSESMIDFVCLKDIEEDPNEQILYWIDGKINKLCRANRFGEKKEILCDAYAGGNYPSLTLDTLQHYLYWIDTKESSIKLCRFNIYANRREDLMEVQGSLEDSGLVVIGL